MLCLKVYKYKGRNNVNYTHLWHIVPSIEYINSGCAGVGAQYIMIKQQLKGWCTFMHIGDQCSLRTTGCVMIFFPARFNICLFSLVHMFIFEFQYLTIIQEIIFSIIYIYIYIYLWNIMHHINTSPLLYLYSYCTFETKSKIRLL